MFFGASTARSTGASNECAKNTAPALSGRCIIAGLVLSEFAIVLGSAVLVVPLTGRDFFRLVDAGQFRLHVRAPAGTRLEETDQIFNAVEAAIARIVPREETALVLHNIGLPLGGVNLAFSDSSTIGPADGEILVALKPGHRRSTL